MVTEVDAWGGLDVIFNNAGIMHAKVCIRVYSPLLRKLTGR
jgi:hypothetical protein